MRHSATKGLLIIISVLLLVFVAAFLWKQLPDAEPARLRQECKETLQQIYVALVAIGEANSDTDETDIERRLTKYLSNQQEESLLRCPGSIDREQGTTAVDYYVNPNVDLEKLVANECEKSLVLACDKFGNHIDGDGMLINFLLADGSVISRNMDSDAYEKWITAFRKGLPEALPARSKNSNDAP